MLFMKRCMKSSAGLDVVFIKHPDFYKFKKIFLRKRGAADYKRRAVFRIASQF